MASKIDEFTSAFNTPPWVDNTTDYGGFAWTASGGGGITPQTSGTDSVCYYGDGTFEANNQASKITIGNDGVLDAQWGPCCHVKADGTGFCLAIDGTASTAQIWRMNPTGPWTSLAGPTATTVVAGDVFELVAVSGLLLATRNTVQIGSLVGSQAGGNSEGACGCNAYYSGAETPPIIDKFEGTNWTADSAVPYGVTPAGILIPGANAHGLSGFVKH